MWTVKVLDRALARLRGEALAAGKTKQFEALRSFLSAQGEEVNYQKTSERLQMTPDVVRLEVYRLRRRSRELVRVEVAHTVLDPGKGDT